jgi:DMSO/TMAO reductase YedYZ molybdopterin-dependent catalytic subunit
MKKTGVLGMLGMTAACLLTACSGRLAQTAPEGQPVGVSPAIRIDGDLAKPGEITLDALKARESREIEWSEKGKSNRYRGIPLVSLFEERGVVAGAGGDAAPKNTKHAGLKLVIAATAADGYQAVFSYAELAGKSGPTKAWLVWEMDGQPLPAPMAPFRILVPTDGGADRCIYQVRRLTVVDMRKILR